MDASAIHRARSQDGSYHFAEYNRYCRQFPRSACASSNRGFVASRIVSKTLLRAQFISHLRCRIADHFGLLKVISRSFRRTWLQPFPELSYLLELGRAEPGDTAEWDDNVLTRGTERPRTGGRQKDIEVRLAIERYAVSTVAKLHSDLGYDVGDTGIEPVTSSV
jgi:hypothetical protein